MMVRCDYYSPCSMTFTHDFYARLFAALLPRVRRRYSLSTDAALYAIIIRTVRNHRRHQWLR